VTSFVAGGRIRVPRHIILDDAQLSTVGWNGGGSGTMITRVGGSLLLGSAATAVLAGVAFQGRWSLGGQGTEGVASSLILGLISVGTLLIAIGGRAPFEAPRIRWSLLLVAVGAGALVGSAVRSTTLASDPLGDAAAVTLLLGGMIVLVSGLLAAGFGFARGTGLQRWIAASLLAGLIAVALTSVIGEGLELAGFVLILLGLAGVGSIALGVGSPLEADLRSR
jgi:hypothetical protein